MIFKKVEYIKDQEFCFQALIIQIHTYQWVVTTKVMYAVNVGELSRFKGKSLEEINIDEEGNLTFYSLLGTKYIPLYM